VTFTFFEIIKKVQIQILVCLTSVSVPCRELHEQKCGSGGVRQAPLPRTMTMRPQLTRTAIVYLVVATSVLSATADKHASAQTMCVGKKTVRPLEYELVCATYAQGGRERGREGGRGAGDCENIA